MSRFFCFVLFCLGVMSGNPAAAQAQTRPPNVVLIFIDDMGYGDLGCYGLADAPTPNIDKLAEQGLRLTQFYVNAPICSPSRVALTTGQYPQRHRISSFLNSRDDNHRRQMANYLDPNAPTMAKMFKDAGYATAHFGKWHMGGGRDVGDAPLPQAYGFDESLVSFEGLGDRALINGDGLSRQSAKLGRGEIQWVDKHQLTGIYVDRAVEFIEAHRADQPFYIRVFPNDVHDPLKPAEDDLKRYTDKSDNKYVRQYYAVIEAMDRELGRLFKHLDEQGLADDTIVIFTSDNGPTAWKRYYDQGLAPPGWTDGLRGRKWSLYEGGIREPFIVRWPGHVPAGAVDEQTVMAAFDLFPTLAALTGYEFEEDLALDGLDRSAALLGQPIANRGTPIFWEYGRLGLGIKPGLASDQSPILAVRDGDWKLLMNPDASDLELYNLAKDRDESDNVAADHHEVVGRLRPQLAAWWAQMPQGWE